MEKILIDNLMKNLVDELIDKPIFIYLPPISTMKTDFYKILFNDLYEKLSEDEFELRRLF
jgi:hypothetical protein